MDAIYLPVRPEGPREGVLVAWGFTTDGERILLDVCLGARERTEDWLDLSARHARVAAHTIRSWCWGSGAISGRPLPLTAVRLIAPRPASRARLSMSRSDRPRT